MTKVFLAEKPSQANDIAKIIGIKRRCEGYIELVTGDVMTNVRGHSLEIAAPKDHNPAWGERWNWTQLPMIPTEWKMNIVKGFAGQLKIIKDLLKAHGHVVLCTDAGREGELIGREVLTHCKFKGKVERLWVSTLMEADVRKALANLKPGSATEPLYEAALARSHMDNIWGLSLTRAATLAANTGELFSVGRVQTPVLNMVVMQDAKVDSFNVKDYYELEAMVQSAGGHTFKMTHAPDEAKRIRDKEIAKKMMQQAAKAQGPLSVVSAPGKESPPLPFNLPTLQKEANKAFGFSAKETLDLAQGLYEKKALSYPRTDCAYLAESQKAEVAETLAVIEKNFPKAVATLRSMGMELRSTVFNDAKLTDHHAVVPTRQFVPLEGRELQLFTLVVQRYLRVLSKDMAFSGTKVTMDANGILFSANGRIIDFEGFQAIKLLEKN
jgi:DNA topoisomerase-3